MMIDAIDRRILQASAPGLPLVEHPYAELAQWLGLTEAEVLDRVAKLQDHGVIRRVAVAPNHYALGMLANGMSVWDVDDAQAERLGEKVGALPFVSHCYLRPRARPAPRSRKSAPRWRPSLARPWPHRTSSIQPAS